MTPARSATFDARAREQRGGHALGARTRVVLAPLGRSSTYRGGVFLLLGAVVLLPYVLVGAAFVQMLTGEVPRLPVVVLLALTAVISTAPAFLRPTRALEIHAVRGLLDVDLPDPPAPPSGRSLESAWTDWQSRIATATWYALHLLAGGLLAAVLFVLLPLTVVYGLIRLGMGPEGLVTDADLGGLGEIGAGWLSALAVVLCAGTIYLTAGLSAGLARLAPVLLGPSAAERVAALEATAADLAVRNRLARELHDSVGHALTVTTLQAAAARTVLDADPAFARQALLSIEEAGRSAMADLDRVLGLLRAADNDAAPSRAPQPTLADLGRLVADSAAAGLVAALDVRGEPADVPPDVSREGYRIVQESLTNALRHGTAGRAGIRVIAGPDALDVEVRNPAQPAADAQIAPHGLPSGGRGLAGMQERVRLLRGAMTAGWAAGEWTVTAHLPYDLPAERDR